MSICYYNDICYSIGGRTAPETTNYSIEKGGDTMENILNVGTEIMRADGTRETYYGWDMEDIKRLEKAYHNYTGTLHVIGKVYEIENEFHRYTYNEENCIFRDHYEPADEITEIETDYAIADYLWRTATEADEDSVRAYKLMAVDIFGDFEKWRAMAFWHMMQDFERDVNYLKET